MSGIVNIITKEGQQSFAGTVTAYVGDYLTGDGYAFNGGTAPFYDPNAFDGPVPGIYYNLDDVSPFDNQNLEGSLSGPVGFADMTFYLSGRYFQSRGWLYGNAVITPSGTLVPGYVPEEDIVFVDGIPAGIRLRDNPVPMNSRKRLSGQAKLTIPFSGSMKLGLSGIGSRIDFRDYNHSWFLLPDGDVHKYDRAYTFSGLLTHSLGSSAFYTINGAYSYKGFQEYLYSDPFDPRYVSDPNATTTDLYEWITSGTNNHRFKRRTETVTAKVDYTDQVSRLHQIKAGIEFRSHRLYLEDYTLVQAVDANGIPTGATAIPELTSPSYEDYTRRPGEFSAYLQDKLEYENMIVNIGLRFDWFDPNANVLADPNDPNVYLPRKPENQPQPGQSEEEALAERQARWYKDAGKKWYVSPRLGISYPITDRGILHFSYGHFLQIPSFDRLYDNPDWKVSTASGIQGVYGNPDLRPEQTISYEFGLQQQMSDVLSFDLTMFYRDTRNWVTTSTPIPVGDFGTNTSSYTTYINRDYANSRGVTLSVIKRLSDYFSFNLTYMFQVAEGNNSNPDDEQAAQQNNREPARSLTPLDWDQTHTANLSLGVGQQDWGANVIGRYGSGLPYDPVINQAEARGEDASRAVQNNSRRRPDQLTIDLRLYKDFFIEPVTLGVFMRVFNLFDSRNEVDVWGETGRATATPEALGAGNVNQPGRANTVEAFLVQPQRYSEPREIQIGVEVRF
jgi:outer membrane receptor protein involved in Fe transport